MQIEAFEKSQLPSDARLVANQYQRLNWSRGETDQQLARLIDTHYRNANLRISVSRALLNRMIPPQPSRTTRITDTILGNPTQGWGTTDTQLGVRLIPDASHLRFACEGQGQTYAETDTTQRPGRGAHAYRCLVPGRKRVHRLAPRESRTRPVTVEAESMSAIAFDS